MPGPPLTSARAVRETAETYDAIFDGVIVKVVRFRPERHPGVIPLDELVATVALTDRWRGVAPDTIVVRTGFGTAACGLPFSPGERYLLFARNAEGNLYADKCGPSRAWDKEAERLVKLLDDEYPVQ